MKRSFLEELGIEKKEVINEIMKEHGRSRQEMAEKTNTTELVKDTEALQQQVIELQEQINKLESMDYETEISQRRQEIDGYKADMLRMQVASEHGIPYELAGKLNGTNADELKADAEQLAGYMQQPKELLPLAQPPEKKPYDPLRSMVQDLTF